MPNKRPDDIRFLINAFSISLVIVALLVTFQPYFENEPRMEEVRHVEQQLVKIGAEDVARMVAPQSARPVMLVVYASWCYFCRQVMPVVVNMIRKHELDDVTPVFVSLDDEPRKLSLYMVRNDYHSVFTPYVVGYGYTKAIVIAMEPSGSGFKGAIPYVGFFSRDGKVKAESVGFVNERKLLSMAGTVRQ